MRRLFIALALSALFSGTAMAEPDLQLYVEGSTYNTATSTWTINSTIGESIRLWVIGQPTDNNLSDVRLYLASPTTDHLTFTITPDRIGGTGSYLFSGGTTAFHDSGLASVPTSGATGNGTTPPSQSPHGIYGGGVSWQEEKLGSFNLDNTTIADFSGTSPINPDTGKSGTIYAYDIKFTGSSVSTPVPLNIDAGYFFTDKKGDPADGFAPYSHTARGAFGGPGGVFPPQATPEPSTLAIAGLGAIGFVGYQIRRRWGRNTGSL
jgi:hypothetical protein